MKLALLTHHWVPNFGANLQALSTYSYFKKNGHEIEVLNYIPKNLEDRYRTICTEEQFKQHILFCEEHLSVSPLLRSADELKAYCDQAHFDVVICGSDAIFRLDKSGQSHEGPFPNPYWLHWVNPTPATKHTSKAFISASCTGSNYLFFPKAMKQGIHKALSDVDFISVRDGWTRFMLKHVTKGEIIPQVTPDPVSIFEKVVTVPQQYSAPAMDQAQRGKYILFSMHPMRVSESWVKQFVSYANAQGYQVLGLPFPERDMPFDALNGNIKGPVHPLEWYSWIKHSSGFVGERFHPVVCSIFNNVPFVAVDHYRKRGIRGKLEWINIPVSSKVFSLCKEAKLGNNCVHFPKLEKLSGQEVMNMLESFDHDACSVFQEKARAVFFSALESITTL